MTTVHAAFRAISDSRPDYKIRAQGSDPTRDSCAEPRITPHSPTAGKSHGSSTGAPHAVARLSLTPFKKGTVSE